MDEDYKNKTEMSEERKREMEEGLVLIQAMAHMELLEAIAML